MKETFKQIGSVFSGLFIVLKHMFRRPITIQYPEQKRKLPPRSRGRHYLTKWETFHYTRNKKKKGWLSRIFHSLRRKG